MKVRLDMLLVRRGLVESREKAQALIMAGQVDLDGRAAAKAGTMVDEDADVRVIGPDHPWVSRGGLKLAHALDTFAIDVTGRLALDVGASTGGFTDVLLARGARHVIAVDVGHGQLHWKLRNAPRVTVIEGLNALTKEWEPPLAGQRYSEFQAGVQLANRGGALNEIEYSEFVQKVEDFAEGVGAMADFPDMLEVVARARELDTFAGEHDAQLAVHLRSRSVAWSVGFIQQHAARHGFVPGMVPGRLVLPGAEEGAPPVLTLAFDSQAALADDPNQSALRDVTLSFDVPQTDPASEPFVAWQASAQALSLGMDAAIVDDNGNALAAEGFAIIGSELKSLYDALEARGLPAGSSAARRLFS